MWILKTDWRTKTVRKKMVHHFWFWAFRLQKLTPFGTLTAEDLGSPKQCSVPQSLTSQEMSIFVFSDLLFPCTWWERQSSSWTRWLSTHSTSTPCVINPHLLFVAHLLCYLPLCSSPGCFITLGKLQYLETEKLRQRSAIISNWSRS